MVLRIASIGYGDIAQRRHFPQLQALAGRAELVAIAGRDARRLRECAARFDIPRCYTDPATMLRDADIDAVLVVTPPDSHADYAEMAVRAGKHVMVEKPLVRTPEEAARLTASVRARNAIKPITFFPLPHFLTAEFALVDRVLKAAAIGRVTTVENHRGHRGPTHASWFYSKALAGGGVLLDLGIYQLTSVAAMFGPAVRMTACCTRQFESRTMDDGSVIRPDVEDSALINLVLESGVTVSINANWNGCLSHHATRARAVVIGREGILHFGVADGAVYVFRPDGNYNSLPVESEPAMFDGQTCRKLRPQGHGGPASIVGDFVAMIEAGDVSTRALDIQAHLMDIVARAYGPAGVPPAIPLAARF